MERLGRKFVAKLGLPNQGEPRKTGKEVKGVNRVVYDVTSKPPGTIEWE